MNQREKLLAALVGVMMFGIVTFFAAGAITSSVSSRSAQITQLNDEIGKKIGLKSKGMMATKRMALYEQRSLPGDTEIARSVYQRWLLESVAQVQLSNISVNAVQTRTRGEVYRQLSFKIDGRGNLEQLSRWLHNFYSVGYLHRIRQLTVTPIRGTKDLVLNMTVEALSLTRAAKQKKLDDVPPGWLANTQLSDYTDAILGRNLFGPPNQPPRLTTIRSQRANPGRTLSFTAEAIDADPLDIMTYSLVDSQLPGATIDPDTGRFNWQPTDNGEYQVTVQASDDGYPSRSGNQMVIITVSDPAPFVDRSPRPTFDVAQFTWLTSILEIDGEATIWLFVRTTGEKLVFSEGDRFEIGSISGVISRIGTRDIEIDTGDRKLVVAIGDSLGRARELPAKDI